MRFIRPARAGLGLAAAALLVTACGQTQAGSAIVWDSGRITDNDLAGQTQVLIDEFGVPASPELTQFTITRLAQNVVVDEAAAEVGVTVTEGEVDRATQELIAEYGGEEALAEFLAQQGVPRDQLAAQVRTSLLFQAISEKLDPNFDPTVGSTVANQLLVDTSNNIELATNPRFGVWDPQRLTVVPDPNALTRPGDNDLQVAPQQLTPSQ
ncbi:MAG: hypothetical protein QG597_3753 [Actinomycetota bacterium]|nr:hypothetical protein [Actinomycetota bacterium]